MRQRKSAVIVLTGSIIPTIGRPPFSTLIVERYNMARYAGSAGATIKRGADVKRVLLGRMRPAAILVAA